MVEYLKESRQRFASVPIYLSGSIGILWLWSGLQPVFTARKVSLDLLAQTGMATSWQMPALIAASLLDIAFAAACFSSLRHDKRLWAAQLATVAVYSGVIAICLPENWLHPFAPLVKNLPIAALMFYLMKRSGQ